MEIEKKNPEQLFRLIVHANENGNSAYELATMYLHGIGLPHDEQKAFYYLRHAMDLGNEKAVELFGLIYKYGEWDFRRNALKAAQYFEEAYINYNQNDISLYEALNAYFYGDSGKPLDVEKGIGLLEIAAYENGFANYFLGNIYSQGLYGVEKNEEMAEKYYLLANEKGYPKGR